MTSHEADVRARIERYLGRVEAHLEGLPGEEREEVIRDVEAHIYDALGQRSEEDDAVAAVEGVLIEMDPPSSWGPPPRRVPVSPPPVPAPPQSLLRIETVLLGIGAIILFLCFLPVWGANPSAARVPTYGLLVFTLLLTVVAIVAAVRFASNTAGLSPHLQRDRVSSAAFILLLAALGAVGFSIVAEAAAPRYRYYEPGEENLRRADEAMENLADVALVASITIACVAFFLSFLLGRFALSADRDGARLSGWSFYRAAISPALVALGLIGGLLFIPFAAGMVAFVEVNHEQRRNSGGSSASPELAGLTDAALALAILLIIVGVVIRFAPKLPRVVLYPLTARLAPSHGKWYILAGIAFLLIYGVLRYATAAGVQGAS